MKRAVFLDRDGILLDHSGSIFPGTKATLHRLEREGFLLIVATNQPDIAAKKMKSSTASRIHAALLSVLPLRAVKICEHDDMDFCECRKPKPGMLIEAATQYDIDLPASFMIGDRWRDISAGHAAKCKTILVGTGYGEPFPVLPDYHVAELNLAVDIILGAV